MQLNSSDLSSPSNLIIFSAPLLSTFQITLQKKKKNDARGPKMGGTGREMGQNGRWGRMCNGSVMSSVRKHKTNS